MTIEQLKPALKKLEAINLSVLHHMKKEKLPYEIVVLKRKETLFNYKKKTGVYFIVEGCIVRNLLLTNGQINSVDFVTKNVIVNCANFKSSIPFEDDYLAITETKLAFIPNETILLLLEKSPLFLYTNLQFELYLSYLRRMNEHLSTKERIIFFLVELFRHIGSKKKEGYVLPSYINQSVLAGLAAVTRETVSRVLNQLVRENLLEIKPKPYFTKDLDLLADQVSLYKQLQLSREF
ncbi:Crp/Fnr family transcriptional regulator [Carnobacterium gallinarum]|uniref:Crp/Fnr family transcriptional regulator n=1 Tax=Carnobacterium gallinarum TaxID=2749 RepID=UPI000557A578|nr:Crp/Fnr family transcriptional regulator [Carnobacterium gallinarum]